MFKIRKTRNNVIREKMDIKNSVFDYRRYKQLNWYGQVQRMDQGRLPRRIRKVSTWKTKKGKTSQFLDAGGYNRDERGGELANWSGSTERCGERKLIYLRTERCENIKQFVYK